MDPPVGSPETEAAPLDNLPVPDPAQRFPLPKVARWIGNTPAVAMRHYVDVTDEDFRRAAQGTSRLKEHPGEKGAQLGAQSAATEGAGPDLPENQLTASPLGSTSYDSSDLRSTDKAEVHGNRTHRLHVFRAAQRF